MSAEEAEKADLLGAFTDGKRVTYKGKLHGRITYTSPVNRPIHGDPYVHIMITPNSNEQEPFVIKSSEIKKYGLRIYSSRRRHSIGGRRPSKTRRRMK